MRIIHMQERYTQKVTPAKIAMNMKRRAVELIVGLRFRRWSVAAPIYGAAAVSASGEGPRGRRPPRCAWHLGRDGI
jgi:hypothetical protein